jgi:hypothetical protein
VAMDKSDLDQLRLAYKKAVDEWIEAIRAEEALATPDHSMVAMERWDDAHLREHDSHEKAREARDAYKDALRGVNYGIGFHTTLCSGADADSFSISGSTFPPLITATASFDAGSSAPWKMNPATATAPLGSATVAGFALR